MLVANNFSFEVNYQKLVLKYYILIYIIKYYLVWQLPLGPLFFSMRETLEYVFVVNIERNLKVKALTASSNFSRL